MPSSMADFVPCDRLLQKAHCAIAGGTRVHCYEDFRRRRAGEMASEIPEMVYAFGPQLNAFMAVGILIKYFLRNLL